MKETWDYPRVCYMKVLVTGSKGFVGAATFKILKKRKIEVIGYDFVDGFDVCDQSQLESVVQIMKPDRVLHLAAIASFNVADDNPKSAFEINVIGTKNVVAVAKMHNIPLVYASTGSVYLPITDQPPITETFRGRGNSTYGSTKYLGELYVQEHNQYIILRYSHLYGRGKRTGGLIDSFTERIGRGLPPKIYGGKQSNDFTYIKDVAEANYCALVAPEASWNQTYNIGTGEEVSTKNAFKVLCEITGWTGEVIREEQRAVDADRFFFDVSKAERMLNFKARFSFEEGLRDMFRT